MKKFAWLLKVLIIAIVGIIPSGCTKDVTDTKDTAINESVSNKKPNIVFVFADQWRRQAVGCMNEDPVSTPNIDKFAGESLLFTNALSVCPICVPARASIITGRYPQSTTVIDNSFMLPVEEVSIAHTLNKAGYHTGYIGKWHLDGRHGNTTYVPVERRAGFQFWYANNLNHNHYLIDNYTDADTHIVEECWQIDHETDVAIDYIKKHKTEPFALFISFAPPHPGAGREGQPQDGTIYSAPEKYEAMYKDLKTLNRPNFKDCQPVVGARTRQDNGLPGYFGAITNMDDNFGRLMDTLKKEGLIENTIVVLHADHGDMLGSHGLWGKKVWYEESVGVPFIISWYGNIQTGKTDVLFNQVDIVPSLLGLIGVDIPVGVEGINMTPIMQGKEMDEPDFTFLVYPDETGKRPWYCVRTKKYSYVVISSKNKKIERLLYDLELDPYQMQPITMGKGQDELMKNLEGKLRDWLKNKNDTFWELLNW